VDQRELSCLRKRLGKTQKELSHLLGVSLRAIHAYEQGWRAVPVGVERQLLFLVSRTLDGRKRKPCWVIKKCSDERRKKCPAREYKAGDLCWFINGTLCEGRIQQDWAGKMKICRKCAVFRPLLAPDSPPR